MGGWTVARWRQPVVIWLRRARKNRYWRRKARDSRPRRQIPWVSAGLYGVTLLLAAAVLSKVPSKLTSIAVSTQLTTPTGPSRLDRLLSRGEIPDTTFRSWLNAGVPLVGLVLAPWNFRVHLRQLLTAGIRVTTGVPITSLNDLLAAAIPELQGVPAPKAVVVPRTSLSSRKKGQDAVEASLPGDGGRVWAQLGARPVVGIYQTYSHESFWPYVSPGPATPYSMDWPKTIVQVGWWLSQDLYQQGIAVVQSRVDNMSEGLLASFNKSYQTARQLVAWYPSVRLLIDLHRAPDTMAPAIIHGQKVSKIVIVVGTSQLLPNPYGPQNLLIAEKLSQALNSIAPGILGGKGIDKVPYRYNQQLMPGDLMIEVGGPNSSLEQERLAVADLAKALTRIILDKVLPTHLHASH